MKSERLPARVGLALAGWSERWFPDPMVVALLGVVVVFALGVLGGVSPARLASEGGKSFWALVRSRCSDHSNCQWTCCGVDARSTRSPRGAPLRGSHFFRC